MNAGTVLGAIGKPSGLSGAGNIVFDVTALIDNSTVLDSFDAPVTIIYHYTDADVAGLNEQSLTMYHYHSGAWQLLNGCTVDTTANTITCSTASFSTFALFGSPTTRTHTTTSSGGSIQSQVAALLALGEDAKANALKQQWYWLFPQSAPASTTPSSVRDLTIGMTGSDVRALQQLLNAHGFVLVRTGVGSPGSETDHFGALTRTALARFQSKNAVRPAIGYFGPLTRAKMKTLGFSGTWW